MGAMWLRWTWRDFKARWIQIVATGLILAIGAGAFAGLRGLQQWREESADASFAELRAHDLRVDLAEGTFASAGELHRAIRGLGRSRVVAAEERLVAAAQVDASRGDRSAVVPAEVVGLPVRAGGQAVDVVSADRGRPLAATDAGRLVAVIDRNFAKHYDLPDAGTIRLAGAGRVPYVGQGVTPGRVLITDESGMSGAEAGLAVVYMPLRAAQRATGRPDAVNRLVIRAAPGADLTRLERDTKAALAGALPGVGVELTRGAGEQDRRILYRDARNDQKVFTAFAVLLLLGAGFAAFNLVRRVVDAQRREIGIGMGLGVESGALAIRPLAAGAQIAVVGGLLTVPIGTVLGEQIKAMMKEFWSLPAYADVFPLVPFLTAIGLALLIPIVAAVAAVRTAVMVQPIEAIRSGHRAARGGGLAPALRRVRLPGRSVAQLPIRNLARNPRRTLMTVLGLAGVLATVVGISSMVESIGDTADRQERETLRMAPDRVEVELTGPQASNGPAVARVASLHGVDRAQSGLTVGATVAGSRGSLDLALSIVPSEHPLWRPSLTSGSHTGGILLSAKAADDVGARVGDAVTLRYARPRGDTVVIARSRVRLAGIHRNPVRAFAYLDERDAAGLGLGGIANTVTITPTRGSSPVDLQRSLFGREGVASAREASSVTDAVQKSVDGFNSSIGIVLVIALSLAILVGFTASSVAVEERRREFATMFAFGLGPSSGMRVAMTESLATGVLGTLLGVALGTAIAGWVVGSLLGDVFPDLDAALTIGPTTMALAAVVGVVAVTLAPLLTLRRLRTMDVPSTLRVME